MINNPNILMPRTYEELTHQAKRMLNCKALLPSTAKGLKLEEIEAVIQIGQAFGLSPWQSIHSIMIMNGQPSVWGDFLIGLVWASGKAKDIKEWSEGTIENKDYTAFCEAKRENTTTTRKFSIEDARKASLWNKPIWQKYPKRMLQMRARSWCLRDAFADVTKGLVAVEESIDYDVTDKDKTKESVENAVVSQMTEAVEVKKEIDEKPEVVDAFIKEENQELIDKILYENNKRGLDISEEEVTRKLVEFVADKPVSVVEMCDRANNNFYVFYEVFAKDSFKEA